MFVNGTLVTTHTDSEIVTNFNLFVLSIGYHNAYM